MKKLKLLLLLFILGISIKSFSQSMIRDALYLKDFYNSKTGKFTNNQDSIKLLAKVLKGHLREDLRATDYLDIETVLGFFEKNPFTDSLIPSGRPQNLGDILGIFGNLSGIPNADVTQFADGLAKFLVKRTKEELSVAFFNQFKEDMNSDKYSDFRILFPQTARLLNLIDNKIYQFSAYLTELREAFIIDLNSLPSSALVVINLPKYNDYFTNHPELKKALHAGLFISNLVLQNDSLRHIGNVVKSMEVDRYFPKSETANGFYTAMNGGLKTLQLLSASLRSLDTTGAATETQRYWVSTDSLFMMLNDPIAFKIYLGLLYQEADNTSIVFGQNVKLTTLLENAAREIEKLQNTITDFYAGLNAYDEYKKQYNNVKLGLQEDSLKLHAYSLFSSSVFVLESGLALAEKFGANTSAVINKIVPTFRNISEIYMYTNQKKYGPAVLSLVKLYTDIFDKDAKQTMKLTKLIASLSTYGSFISQIAKAENSDEVADIIEKTVLPTGSSYIKKHSTFNIALQAYTGFYGGQQRQATDTTKTAAMGVYAPLGIGFSWGGRQVKKNGDKIKPSSFSAFISVIDVGSLVSYRFSNENDSLANDIKIRLNQILAPGLHLVYGFPKVPLSFGIGANWTPLITKVESNAISVLDIKKRPFRWQAFLAVDIPFLNFYNKPR